MDKKIYYNDLYDCYGRLFTEKQRAYFEDYYFRDLSLGEIAENYGVSRNAVHGQIKIVEEKLEYYEKELGLSEKGKEIRSLLPSIADKEIRKKIENLL